MAFPSKRFGEKIVLGYTPVWMLIVAVIVKWKLYESYQSNDYISLGLVLISPCLFLPLVLADKDENLLSLHQRYSFKANVFIGILSYLGNHFYTHYFYNVLGMRYTGPLASGFQINQVPVSMFLMTHVYFLSYHVIVTKLLRLLVSICDNKLYQNIGMASGVIVFAILTAFLETYTISNFPYYTYPDYYTMLTKGSVFYSLFLIVTFPLFYFIDEKEQYSIGTVVMNGFGGMMIVLLLADIWRLISGYLMVQEDNIKVPYS